MKKMNNKGFSLVELIIVIAIMAILVAVLAPTYLKFVERSRKSTDCQNVAEAITAIQTYAADPMIPSADQLKVADDNTLSISTEGTAYVASAGSNIDKALTNAGITSINLKSSKWGATTVVLTVKVKANGTVEVSQTTPAATSKVDIVKGLYE